MNGCNNHLKVTDKLFLYYEDKFVEHDLGLCL